MVQFPGDLDATFAALADPTRRGMLDRLGRGEASISDLAAQFRMTLTGAGKHVRVLESAGLARSRKVGRVRTCRLEPRALAAVERWIVDRRALWEGRLDRLGAVLETAEASQPDDRGDRGRSATREVGNE